MPENEQEPINPLFNTDNIQGRCDDCAKPACEGCGNGAAFFNGFWDAWLCLYCVEKLHNEKKPKF